jgi:hypothetical protein
MNVDWPATLEGLMENLYDEASIRGMRIYDIEDKQIMLILVALKEAIDGKISLARLSEMCHNHTKGIDMIPLIARPYQGRSKIIWTPERIGK